MTERLNIELRLNKKIISPVILVKKSVCKILHLLCSFFIFSDIVQGILSSNGNLHSSVNVLRRFNPATDESDSMAFEKKQVKMQHQQDWVTELENIQEKTEKLNLSKKKLKILPACLKDTKNLKELNISKNSLGAVLLKLLVGNRELEKLDISHNRGVVFLTEGIDLKSLKWLKAEYCEWKAIPANLGRFSQLEELYLRGNSLKSFDQDFFLNLPSLKVLDLSGNRHITFESHSWTSLKNLRCLVLFDMGLDKIPDNIGTLKKLTSLDVSNNKIKHLDPKMFLKLGSLEELDIGNNLDLVIDEPAWESLKGLRCLNVEGLGMTGIPVGLKKLTKLQKLILSNNSIPVLNPADFAGFSDLEYLEFNILNNNLEVVTTEWNHLKSLKKLIINGSTLEVLYDWVGELQSLEELNLSWGQIHTINDKFFVALSKLPNFKVLNLEINSLHTLPLSILLLKNKKVKILLKGNNINPQPSETNVGLERLKKEFGENIVI